jgi:hypothetical protein
MIFASMALDGSGGFDLGGHLAQPLRVVESRQRAPARGM